MHEVDGSELVAFQCGIKEAIAIIQLHMKQLIRVFLASGSNMGFALV